MRIGPASSAPSAWYDHDANIWVTTSEGVWEKPSQGLDFHRVDVWPNDSSMVGPSLNTGYASASGLVITHQRADHVSFAYESQDGKAWTEANRGIGAPGTRTWVAEVPGTLSANVSRVLVRSEMHDVDVGGFVIQRYEGALTYPPLVKSTQGALAVGHPQAVPGGKILVPYLVTKGAASEVHVASTLDGVRWDDHQIALFSGNGSYPESVSTTAHLCIAWAQDEAGGSSSVRMSCSQDAGNSWTAPIRVDQAQAGVRSPLIAEWSGTTVVAWLQADRASGVEGDAGAVWRVEIATFSNGIANAIRVEYPTVLHVGTAKGSVLDPGFAMVVGSRGYLHLVLPEDATGTDGSGTFYVRSIVPVTDFGDGQNVEASTSGGSEG